MVTSWLDGILCLDRQAGHEAGADQIILADSPECQLGPASLVPINLPSPHHQAWRLYLPSTIPAIPAQYAAALPGQQNTDLPALRPLLFQPGLVELEHTQFHRKIKQQGRHSVVRSTPMRLAPDAAR